MENNSLSGKTIVVTGAASGIGAETARLLAGRGAEIIALDRNEPEDGWSQYIPVDFSNSDSITQAVMDVGGQVEALCNIAGVPPTAGEVQTLKVNFLGLRYFTELMVPKLAQGGSIVNMASLAGFEWRKSLPVIQEFLDFTLDDDLSSFCAKYEMQGARAYFFSKEALRVWTMQNAFRWANRGIRMNCVSPGPVETPILKDFIASLGKRAEDDLKKNRAGRVEEIAPVVAFLCSDDSRWINGANIPVDGGALAAALGEIHSFVS